MLEIGTKAPQFCLPNQDEVEICLRDLQNKWVVLYFYPRDLTPGCTNEAIDFSALNEEFENLGAVILGVSPDNPKKHRSFIEKKDLKITLLSDEDTSLCQKYGIWGMKKFMGKEFLGVNRTTFLINPKGEIARIWEKVTVRKKKKIDGETCQVFHAREVKKTLEELS